MNTSVCLGIALIAAIPFLFILWSMCDQAEGHIDQPRRELDGEERQ